MATWADVKKVVLSLPGTEEVKANDWRVKGKLLAWERPLRKADLAALGDSAPKGNILGVWVPDLDTKEALLATAPEVYFTTPHFDGYAAVLVRLGAIRASDLKQLLVQAWLDRAPKTLVRGFQDAAGDAKAHGAARRAPSKAPRPASPRTSRTKAPAGRR